MNRRDKRKELKRKFIKEEFDKYGLFSSAIPLWKRCVGYSILTILIGPFLIFIGTLISGLLSWVI